jgi:hypothetical protein
MGIRWQMAEVLGSGVLARHPVYLDSWTVKIKFIHALIVMNYIGYSFKFILKVGVEESIVNAPQIMDHGAAVYI